MGPYSVIMCITNLRRPQTCTAHDYAYLEQHVVHMLYPYCALVIISIQRTICDVYVQCRGNRGQQMSGLSRHISKTAAQIWCLQSSNCHL